MNFYLGLVVKYFPLNHFHIRIPDNHICGKRGLITFAETLTFSWSDTDQLWKYDPICPNFVPALYKDIRKSSANSVNQTFSSDWYNECSPQRLYKWKYIWG